MAAYYASCGGHADDPEVALDVVLGTWGVDNVHDHVTFSCRTRPGSSMAVDATVAVDAVAVDAHASELVLGRVLTRTEALAHPWVAQFWQVVDAIILGDPDVIDELKHPGDIRER